MSVGLLIQAKNLSVALLGQVFALLVKMSLMRGVTEPLPKTINNHTAKIFNGGVILLCQVYCD